MERKITIDEAKAISIEHILNIWGYFAIKELETQKTKVFKSPFRDEKTPSFHLVKNSNMFKDFGTDMKAGDPINLVCAYFGYTIPQALAYLTSITKKIPIMEHKNFPFYEPNNQLIKETSRNHFKIKPLTDRNLQLYIQSRGIPIEIWKNQPYICQAEYIVQHNGFKKLYKNVAWKTDKEDSYEIRSFNFKGTYGQKMITTIPGQPGMNDLNIFEGFFNYLAFLTYYKTIKPKNKTIILNSTSNISLITSMLTNYNKINLFLDNDAAGQKASEKIIKSVNTNCLVINQSLVLHRDYNDFNDFILNIPIKKT